MNALLLIPLVTVTLLVMDVRRLKKIDPDYWDITYAQLWDTLLFQHPYSNTNQVWMVTKIFMWIVLVMVVTILFFTILLSL